MSSRRATEGSWQAHQRLVLSCNRQRFSVKDVLDTAWFSGALELPWTRLLQALACERRAAELDQQADAEALQAMSEEFRYDRDLLTAEETETWLAGRDLTEDDFGDYFLRDYWRQHLEPQPEPDRVPYPDAAADLCELLRVDLVISGEFDGLAQALSWRVAALGNEHNAGADVVMAKEKASFFQRTGLSEPGLARALAQLERGREWFEQCLQREAAFRTLSGRWLSEEARARALTSRRPGLTRVEIKTLIAPTQDAAREAVLCLRENESTIEDLAKACGSNCEHKRLFLEDFEAEIQQAFLCATPGEVLGLQESDSGFLVCRVVGKLEPRLDDEEVKTRIDQRLLESGFSELTHDRVQWARGAEPA
jgi:hypothetical protein